MKKLISILLLASVVTLYADNPITDRATLVADAKHITTKTTTNVAAATCYVQSIAICVTGAGTSQTLTIVDKGSTAKTLYTAGTAIAVGNTYIDFSQPVLMTGGIDIVTGGTTAGTQDVFVTYWKP